MEDDMVAEMDSDMARRGEWISITDHFGYHNSPSHHHSWIHAPNGKNGRMAFLPIGGNGVEQAAVSR